MEIRVADERDGEAISALVSNLLVELGGTPLDARRAAEAYQPLATGSAGFAVLALDGGTPVAACTVSFVHALRSLGRYGIIQELYVVPELRGEAIGRQVLERVLDEARARGCHMVELGTPLDGARQIRFYERAGFAAVGARLRWRDS